MPERGSDKHGPRRDEQLEREVESLTHGAPATSRAEEFRQQEGSGAPEDDPDEARRENGGADPRLEADDGDTGGS
jgi:hypothetical protein